MVDIAVKEDCSQHQTSLSYESPLSVSYFFQSSLIKIKFYLVHGYFVANKSIPFRVRV